MIINRNSWHYMLAAIAFLRPPHDLCGYIRCVIGGALIAMISVLVTGFLLALLLYPIWQHMFAASSELAIPSCALWIVVGYASLSIIRQHMADFPSRYAGKWWSTTVFEFKRKPPQPSIMAEYIEAKRSKICPFIEYKEKK